MTQLSEIAELVDPSADRLQEIVHPVARGALFVVNHNGDKDSRAPPGGPGHFEDARYQGHPPSRLRVARRVPGVLCHSIRSSP